jgi:hypothetical protein
MYHVVLDFGMFDDLGAQISTSKMRLGDRRVNIDTRLLSSMQFGEKLYRIGLKTRSTETRDVEPSWIARESSPTWEDGSFLLLVIRVLVL